MKNKYLKFCDFTAKAPHAFAIKSHNFKYVFFIKKTPT